MIANTVAVLIVIIFNIFILIEHGITTGALLPDDCGEGPPVGNCAQDCYAKCINGLKGITDPFEKEVVIAEKNFCILHCKAMVYKPQMKYAPKRRPKYTDVSDCLYPCAYPMSEHCRKGYLSMFFYCDCYGCCASKSPANAELCIAGCHEWYEKRWSSTGTDICHFQPEYAKTPILWCHAFCIWKIVRFFGQNASAIPDINATQAKACTTKCVTLLHNDVPVDYETIFPRCRDNDVKCVNSATIHKFNFSLANMTDAAFEAAIDPLNITLFRETFNNTNDTTEKVVTTKEFKLPVNYTVTLPEGMSNMKKQGVKFKLESGANTRVTMPKYRPGIHISNWIKEADIGNALAQAFQVGGSNKFTGTQSGTLTFTREIEVDGCTHLKKSLTARLATIEVEFNVTVTISDAEGVVPMGAQYLKTAVAWKSDWRGGMTYVRDKDPYSVEMMGTGKLKIEIVSANGFGVSCEEIITGCNSTSRNAQLPCRCNGGPCL